MKSSKFKIMPFFVCCLLSALWSEAQCAAGLKEEKEKFSEFVKHQEIASSPAGGIIAFAGEVPPDGWLLCDGKQYSSLTYPELYEVVREQYAPEDEKLFLIKRNSAAVLEKMFYLPDLRGREIVGVDGGIGRVTTRNMLGESGGEEMHLLAMDEFPPHEHNVQLNGSDRRVMVPSGECYGIAYDGAPKVNISTVVCAGKAHNNMQPYQILNYIINTGQESDIAQLKKKIGDLEVSQRGCAKAWVVFNGSNPDTLNSYGVSSVVRNSIGNYTITFEKPFISSSYCSSLSPTKADCGVFSCADHQTEKSFVFNTAKILGWVSVDPILISACFYGDQ